MNRTNRTSQVKKEIQVSVREKRERTLPIVLDVAAYNKAEEKILLQSQIVDNVSDALITVDKNLIVTSWNKPAEQLYGWKASEIIGKNAAVMLRTEVSPGEIREKIKTVEEKGELLLEVVHYTKENVKIIVESHGIPLKDRDGNVCGFLTIDRDITNRKHSEERMRSEKSRLEILADLVGIFANVTYDFSEALDHTVKKLAVEFGDHCIIRLLNPTRDRFTEEAFYHWDKEHLEFLKEMYTSNVLKMDESYPGEILRSGKPVLIPVLSDLSAIKPEYVCYAEKYGLSSVVIVPVESEGNILGALGMLRDKPGHPFTMDDQLFLQNVAGKIGFAVTKARLFNEKLNEISERKLIEEKIKSALNEKEVLLRELYHRTKNNMQVIYSLLGLKGATVDDEKTRTILEDMGNRILTIAMVHQKLYQAKNLSRIDLKDYITDLVKLLIKSYCPAEMDIKLFLDLESILVSIDTAIPCGLIINELLSNSFKHAFPERTDGEIHVILLRNKDVIEITVSDNGIGIPHYSELINGGTMGVLICKNIAENQLYGDINYNSKKGASCTIRFKDKLTVERI